MHRFYFNECLPHNTSRSDFVSRLTNTIKEFEKLLSEDIAVERGVVTQKLPSEITFEGGYSLLDVIESLPENDVRTFAFSILGKHYPINAFFDESHEKLLENFDNYRFNIEGNLIDALNLATVHFNDGFVFTPALNIDVAKNPLFIINFSKNEDHLELNNLFGQENNTTTIHEVIVQRNIASLGIYEQLLAALGNHRVSRQFARDFNALTIIDQNNIVKHFRDARNRNGITPFFADGDLIKDVTPEKSKNAVYELRIFNPRSIRIYFCEKDQIVYLANIGFKSSGNQDNDIRAARIAIDKLIIIG